MVNTLGVVMVEIKEMNQGNKRWSQPSKDLQKTVPAADKLSHYLMYSWDSTALNNPRQTFKHIHNSASYLRFRPI